MQLNLSRQLLTTPPGAFTNTGNCAHGGIWTVLLHPIFNALCSWNSFGADLLLHFLSVHILQLPAEICSCTLGDQGSSLTWPGSSQGDLGPVTVSQSNSISQGHCEAKMERRGEEILTPP